MKLETLIRRLADRTNCPELEQVLLGKADITSLPMDCLLWQDVDPQKMTPRFVMQKGSRVLIRDPIYPRLQYAGKKHIVSRLIFELMTAPNYEYRMYNRCGHTTCVNPLHWDVEKIKQENVPVPQDSTPIPECSYSDEWTEQDVMEVTEIVIARDDPKTFEELIANPSLEGAPRDIIEAYLASIGKDLLPA